ncbi:unnamed protein product [Lactuca saligna]|uniref:SBP-type domain-containing protein n=1 Tax=Lactuca saligna TaxID=75948 RepID=A0AA35ZYH4_LACSI|nr:unnamed protein product [Lactuca saligna]
MFILLVFRIRYPYVTITLRYTPFTGNPIILTLSYLHHRPLSLAPLLPSVTTTSPNSLHNANRHHQRRGDKRRGPFGVGNPGQVVMVKLANFKKEFVSFQVVVSVWICSFRWLSVCAAAGSHSTTFYELSKKPLVDGVSVSWLVDGCTTDLSSCRDYHRRHRVCEAHSKTPVVAIAGKHQRFCQQCSSAGGVHFLYAGRTTGD